MRDLLDPHAFSWLQTRIFGCVDGKQNDSNPIVININSSDSGHINRIIFETIAYGDTLHLCCFFVARNRSIHIEPRPMTFFSIQFTPHLILIIFEVLDFYEQNFSK